MKKSLVLIFIFLFVWSVDCLAKTVKGYYPSGVLKYVEHYNGKNQLDGWYKYYFPNGKLKEQGVFKNDKIVGTPKRYYPDGSPIVAP